MHVRFASYGDLDVATTVAQMDTAVSQLRAAWQRLWDAHITVWFVDADAINNRALAVKRLIDDLDVGGVGRARVFFPPAGFTQDQTWREWQEFAEHARQELNGIGASIGKWSFTSVASRIGQDVQTEFSKVGTWMLWLVGGVLAIQVVGLARDSKRRGVFSRYRRGRR